MPHGGTRGRPPDPPGEGPSPRLPDPAGAARSPRLPDADRWIRVKKLFLEALDRPEAERAGFLACACAGDAALLAEVTSLLASEQAAGGFGETPAAALLEADGPAGSESVVRLAPGTRLGAYEVAAFVSAGGMGEVYRARHIVLGRQVAIKTLNARSADPAAKRRLIREARHAAILDHPNICTIHEIGDADGTPFIVMEYVDGVRLGDAVRGTPAALDDALAWGMQVADALEHAHRHGIVHRDLKSSNIVIDRDGRAIVLDFGLARRVVDAADGGPRDTTTTGLGSMAGTLSHMAPEVLLGRPADVRSDLWSFGVLLYELVTGALPFQGQTPFETSSAILGDPARPIGHHVPLALRLVIERCLTKDPEARYQRAEDVRAALDAIGRRRAWPLVGRLLVSAHRRAVRAIGLAAALGIPLLFAADRLRDRIGFGGARIATVALLPLENATGDPGAAYYAEGLTDALIGQLGSMAEVRIIARASAARAERTAASRAEVARQLGADAILEGRLREAGDRIAVDLRLIEPARGHVVWSDTWERAAGNVLALQADVVRALAAEIRLTLRPGGSDRLATVRAVNPAAYEAYLKGRYEWNRRTQASLARAIADFEQAIELDPTWAPAHAALADCYNQFGTLMLGTGSPREFRPRAGAAAIRALQIDPWSAEAHAALGYVRHYDWQFEEAEREFRRAIELNPSYALARIWYANLLMSRGRIDEALEQVYAARDLDPFSLIINTNVGWVLNVAGRYEDAIVHLTRTIELDSTYLHARWRRADALRGAGRYAEAYREAQRVVALAGRAAPTLGALAQAAAALGRTAEVEEILDELRERARRQYVPPGTIADVLLLLGDVDAALPWIERAFDERANWVVYLLLDSAAGPLQRDPRFQDLVARSGLR